MTITTDAFIRRFLAHVLPRGFHRIRNYGILASSARKTSVALARLLLDVAPPPDDAEPTEPVDVRPPPKSEIPIDHGLPTAGSCM
jgi:hypothetical protein